MILTLDSRENPMNFLFFQAINRVGLLPFHRERCYSLKETVQLAHDAGFTVTDRAAIMHMLLPVNTMRPFLPRKAHHLLVRALLPCCRLAGKLPTKRFTSCFIAVLCVK
jgi:hypothetical protein